MENELERADNEHEQRLDIPPSPYIWMMDSELDEEAYCLDCGTALGRDERFFCYDCRQDRISVEEQEFYDSWFYPDEQEG